MKFITIEDVATVVRGSSPRPQGDVRYYGGKIPRLMVSDVTRDGMYVTPKIDFLTEEGATKSRPMKKGDFIIAVSGDPGEPCILSVDACIHDGFVGFRNLDVSKVFTPYLYRFFKYNKLKSKAQAVGAIYKNLNTDQIKGIQIPLPPFPQQQKIANILDAADALKQNNKALIAKYDELTQALFLDMFGDPVSNPKGWEMKLVENVALNEKNSIKAGPFGSSLKKEFYVDKGFKIYGQEQVIKDDMSYGNYYINEVKYKELESCKVKAGDILISLVGTYGKISIIPEIFEEGIINPRLMKLTPNKKIIRPDYLKYLLQSEYVGRQLKLQSRGGTMDIINVGIIRKVTIPLPPINVQNQFLERMFIINEQKYIAQKSLEKSEELFNSLLQKAFKGELV